MKQFEALGLSPEILRPLGALGYETPTPIQCQAIPHVLAGRDLMGLAQTGTGKTAAFGLPLAQRMASDKIKPGPRSVGALILAPTRELVSQIADSLKSFTQGMQVSVRCVVGGASINNQIRDLQRGADILVATPGRLLDLVERGAVVLSTARYLVLDEADQMLDLGFIHALRRIAKLVGTPRQTLLFSATMPKLIEQLSRAYLTDPVRVEVAPAGRPAEKVRQSVHYVAQERKSDLLKQLLSERRDDLSLVFARTKRGAEKLMKQLEQAGFAAASIHGNKSQPQREKAIRAFREGEIRVLVATDVAARGIDIPGVSHVYNYDLPDVPESYVHRIGRTARAGAGGQAVALCSQAEKAALRAIERLTGIAIEVAHGASAATQASGADHASPAIRLVEDERKPRPQQARNGRSRNEKRGQENRIQEKRGQEKRGHENRGQETRGQARSRPEQPLHPREPGRERPQTRRPGRGHKPEQGVRYGELPEAATEARGTRDAQTLPGFVHATNAKPRQSAESRDNRPAKRRRRRRQAA